MNKLLGLDYGSKRVGVAITDDDRVHVFTRPALRIDGQAAFIRAVGELVRTEGVSGIVAGLPLTMRGERGHQAMAIQDVMGRLEEALNIPVDFEDERLTSALADRFTESSADRDSLAAAALLESFLSRTGRKA